MIESAKQWVYQHSRVLCYSMGSLLIALWTLLRFFRQRTIFDLVGQQVLSVQWLHGQFGHANLGQTNYIFKMFLLYMPLHLLPGSPRLKLIILTILVNILTLVLSGIIIERILALYKIKASPALYLAIIWLGAVAGSVFWVQFTNSRNLEVVGGLFLIYLSLRYLQQPRWKILLSLMFFSGLLFFADNLQLYMTAVPIGLYALTTRRKAQLLNACRLIAAFIGGIVIAQLLFLLAEHVLDVHFANITNHQSLAPAALEHAAVATVKAFGHLFLGGADAGRGREAINGLFLLLAALVIAAAYAKRRHLSRLDLLVAYVFAINALVFIASGQATTSGTERYLIMTVPAFILLAGSVLPKVRPTFILLAGTLLLLTNLLFLGRNTVQAARHPFQADAHLASVQRYVSSHPKTLFYASMDTALPTAYLNGSDQTAPLPLICMADGLRKSTGFYSQASYYKHEQSPHDNVAIILDGGSISNAPYSCDSAQLARQLGAPRSTDTLDDGSQVVDYAATLTLSFPN